MLDGFVSNAGQYIHSNCWLALAAVFAGGLLTASNPCVLAMVPLMMSFVAGSKEEKPGVLKAFSFSLVFVLGLAVTFTALGIGVLGAAAIEATWWIRAGMLGVQPRLWR